MQLVQQAFLLFLLNLLDAFLTLYWVRNGFASEGNHLMARLLDVGDGTFLTVKLVVGAIAAIVFWHWGKIRLAKYGLALSLVVYIGLMGIHFFTGLSAFGLLSDKFFDELSTFFC